MSEWDELCRETFSGVNECQESATRIIQKLEQELEEVEASKSEVFIIMRSGSQADFPVTFKYTREEAEAEAYKLDKLEKFFPHYVVELKEASE